MTSAQPLSVLVAVAHQLHSECVSVGVVADQGAAEVVSGFRVESHEEVAEVHNAKGLSTGEWRK